MAFIYSFRLRTAFLFLRFHHREQNCFAQCMRISKNCDETVYAKAKARGKITYSP